MPQPRSTSNSRIELATRYRLENLAAITFYENAGWTVTDRLIHTVEHGISYDEWVLVKRSTHPIDAVESPRREGRSDDVAAAGYEGFTLA